MSQGVWDFGDGTSLGILPGNPNISHTYAGTVTYTVSLFLLFTDGTCVEVTHTVNVPVIADFTMEIGCDPNGGGYNIQLNEQASVIAGNSISSFLWTDNDAANPLNSTLPNPSKFYPYIPGGYDITLEVIDNNGFSCTLTRHIEIPDIGNPGITITSQPNYCEKQSVVKMEYSGNTANLSTFQWDFLPDMTSYIGNPSNQVFITPGLNFVNLTITNNSGLYLHCQR